jgi:competence protein ComEA
MCVVFVLFLALTVAAMAAPILVDINHATAAELKALPGIRDAYAAVIIRNRPYKNKTQLRKFLPYAEYRQIRARIIAKQEEGN